MLVFLIQTHCHLAGHVAQLCLGWRGGGVRTWDLFVFRLFSTTLLMSLSQDDQMIKNWLIFQKVAKTLSKIKFAEVHFKVQNIYIKLLYKPLNTYNNLFIYMKPPI